MALWARLMRCGLGVSIPLLNDHHATHKRCKSVKASELLNLLKAQIHSALKQSQREGAEAMARGDLQDAQQLLKRSMELSSVFEEVSDLGNKLSGLLDDLDYHQEVSQLVSIPEPSDNMEPLDDSSKMLLKALFDPAPVRQHKEQLLKPKVQKKRRSTGEKRTPERAYIVPILEALVALGGSARSRQVIEYVYELMKERLTHYDHEVLSDGRSVRWINTVQWARNQMRNDELLRKDSPHGIWEISDYGRVWLQQKTDSDNE